MAIERGKRESVARILGDPDLYPDEFKAWVPRIVMANVNFELAPTQLPSIENIKYVGGTGTPAFANGWSNYGSGYEDAGFWRDIWGVVHVVGTIKTGTINNVAFTLPAGYRPVKRMIFSGIDGVNVAQRIDVAGNGDVIPVAGNTAYFSLNEITFRAFS